MVRVTVLYPNEAGKRFDHADYAAKHLPMVMERLKGSGMLRYEVDTLAGGVRGTGTVRSRLSVCTSMPLPISRRGSGLTAQGDHGRHPQLHRHLATESRLVRSSWAEHVAKQTADSAEILVACLTSSQGCRSVSRTTTLRSPDNSPARWASELSRNFGDGRGQAAAA